MARIPTFDPGSTEARSPLIAGLTEAVNKISSILDMNTGTLTDAALSEVAISDDDKNRIYQANMGQRLWLKDPALVFKKNGEVITPETDFFEIDYVGGSIAFDDKHILLDSDVVTVTCTYIVNTSKTIADIKTAISDLTKSASKYKGAFDTVDKLKSLQPTGEKGDFAIVLSEPSIYIWNGKEWAGISGSGGGTATKTSYDNGESHMDATNVQDAIDELSAAALPKGGTDGQILSKYGIENYRSKWVYPNNILFLPMGPGGVPYGKELAESWDSLNSRIVHGDFSGICIGDYKPISLTTDEVVIMEVAGVDQYYRCSDQETGHHVDFISRNCLMGNRQFNTTGTNNGNATEKNPWRASNLYKYLENEVWNTLPSELRPYIIEKRILLENRYSSSGPLNESSGWGWENMGKLWIPKEREVWGASAYSEPKYGAGAGLQYPIFMGGSKHIIKTVGNDGSRAAWWEADAAVNSSSEVCFVTSGAPSKNQATYTNAYTVLCFRVGNPDVA